MEVKSGNLNYKINITSKDELGKLASAFNQMTNDLKKSRTELKKHSQNLEKQVAYRTRELSENLKEINDTKIAALNMMEDLHEANEELKELDKAKSNFLNVISHELKTPLTAISAHLDVLDILKSNLNEQEIKSLEAIKRNESQLKMLISNILEIARMESNKFELNLGKMDLKRLIDETIKNLNILSKQKGIELRAEISKLPAITADRKGIG